MAYRTLARQRITLSKIYRQLADEAGVLIGPHSDMPDKLSHEQMQLEQGYMRQAAEYIRQAFEAEEPVFHITVVPPWGISPRAILTSEAVVQTRQWGARRARRAAKDGCRLRAVGSVDVSYNSMIEGRQKDHWAVHLHLLAWLDQSEATGAVRDAGEIQALIREAFHLPPHDTPHCQHPLHVIAINDHQHLNNTVAYHCGSLALHDASNSRRHLRRREIVPSGKLYDKCRLKLVRRKQFTRLMAELGPRAFRVFSGFRQRGDVVELHPKS